ncbi:TetR/AcrR family transcriptional regulator [Gordonia humi]|uniref:AcrR family transcriptional regulator n=1 Tax=Gordonia humi TaxID=686429 RepID=A0A840EQP5_9ACTN|nr:helix-turn-helix domain-containing protein [Gordonia humi]MBB4135155.1 AcrR family transcriptional regulator [Gordonia humi]
MNSRAAAAVDRALDERQRRATADVERILAAAAAVMSRTAPLEPRVADIVAEAGTSNKTFYRYFTGKDDLILAVMERGVGLVASYLEHQLAKETMPAARVDRWIRGMLAQVSDTELASTSRAVTHQVALVQHPGNADSQFTDPLRDLLLAPLADLGMAAPERAADVVLTTTLAMMRRQMSLGEPASSDDIDYFISFCLRGLNVG